MELLQNLTLYDLLGYTLPGTVLLKLVQWNVHGGKIRMYQPTSYWVMLIVLGFLVGIIISELTDRIIRFAIWLWGKVPFCKEKSRLEKVCNKCGINKEQLVDKLVQKKMLAGGKKRIKNVEFKDMENHMSWIYALVQCDKESRIHNYVSGALLCKNMVLVSTVALYYGCKNCFIPEILFAITGLIAFSMRYSKFNSKKYMYSLCWFISDKA